MPARIKNTHILTILTAIIVLLLAAAFSAQPQANAQSATPQPPTSFTATAGDRSVTLNWANPNDDSITGYEIRMRKGYSRWTEWAGIAESDASTTSHVVDGLHNNKRYRFRIRAVNAAGTGRRSAVAQARPEEPSTTATHTPTTAHTPAAAAHTASPTATMTPTPTIEATPAPSTTTPSFQRASANPGVTLSTRSVRLIEGKRATYTIKLDSRPTSDVSITITTKYAPWESIYIVESPHIDGKPRGAPIVFTRDNWDTPQTLTVASTHYSVGEGAHEGTTITHTATGGGYDGVEIPSVEVNIIDTNRTIEITNPLNGTTYAMSEWDSGVTMYVTMHQQQTPIGTPYPTHTLNLSYRGSATKGTDYTAPNTVSCTQFCEFRIKLIDDDAEESDETILVSLSSVPGFWSLLEGWGTQTVTIKDND